MVGEKIEKEKEKEVDKKKLKYLILKHTVKKKEVQGTKKYEYINIHREYKIQNKKKFKQFYISLIIKRYIKIPR